MVALADAGLTAYHAAAKAARRLTPRDTCVVNGDGGLGHIGIQVLKALTPARLVVVDRNPAALELATSIGAHVGVLGDEHQVDSVLDLTDGVGAEVVVDFVGENGSTSRGIAMTRAAGDYHVVGYGENVDVPTIDLISSEKNIIGKRPGSRHPRALTLWNHHPLEPPHPQTQEAPVILIVVKFPIRPDRQSEWEQLSAFYAKAVNAEPGCVFFEFSRSVEDPQTYVCIEGFADGTAGQEHMKQDHVARFMAEMPDIVSAQPQIIYIDAQDVRGFGPMGEITPRGA